MIRRPPTSKSVDRRRRHGELVRKTRRHLSNGRVLLIEPLEDRRLLAFSSPPDQPLLADGTPLDVRLGFINQDSHQDLASIHANGSLTVALNRGDDQWLSAETTPLGLGPLHGMELANVDDDALSDLIVQGPDNITVLRNDNLGSWAVQQTLSSAIPGAFAPSDGGRVRMGFGLLNYDFSFDLAAPSPGTDEVVVYYGNTAGALGAGTHYASGGDEPVSVAIGNFIGDLTPDLALGHRDGSVTFLEGQQTGGLILRPASTVTGLGVVHDLASHDVNGDGELDLVVTGGDRVTLLLNNLDPLPVSPLVNGDFAQALTGWTTEIVGHGEDDQPGTISGLSGAAQFRENESFLVSLRQTFVVPPTPQSLSFDLVSLGLAEPNGGVPDALEASLIDASNHSVVPTHRLEATSFFNANPGGVITTATGVTYVGGRVTVDISDLEPGTEVSIVFDLVGNPPGTTSVAAIDNVKLTPDVIRADTFTATGLLGQFLAADGIAKGDVDGDGEMDFVVADAGQNQLVIYAGNGQGGLSRFEYDVAPFGDSPTAVAIAPLSAGDTIGDVAVVLSDSDLLLTPLGLDQVPPSGTLVSPAPSQTSTGEVTSVVIEFSEAVRDNGISGANSVTNVAAYSLYATGPNGVFDGGAGDDIVVAIATATYDSANRRVTLTVDPSSSPLADGSYELRVDGDGAATAIRDVAGNAINGGQDFVSQFVVNHVGPVNLAAAPITGAEGAVVTYTATFDNPGSVGSHSAVIDWGDGSSSPVTAQFANGQGQVTAQHTYPDNNTYTIHLEVSDESLAGLMDPSELESSATVNNVAPSASAPTSRKVSSGVPVSMLVATFTDPGFDNPPLSSESFTATINWGDGSSASTGTVTVTTIGSEGVLTAGEVTGTHTYTSLGTFTVTVTVADDDGDSHQITFTVTTGSKFSVVDDSSHELFRYDPEFDLVQHSDLAQHTNSPRGVDSNPAGDTFWVVNSSRHVSVYDRDGAFLGQWSATDATQPQGIATDGTHLWLVGVAQDKLYYYQNGAARRSGQTNATSSFNLVSANRNASGLVTDGQKLWVTNDKPGEMKVFVYTISGTLLGSWGLDAANVQPSGIALDPVTGTLWVVDRHTASVFEYAGAASQLSGSLTATAEHPLDPANQNPEGITDPTNPINIGDTVVDSIATIPEVDIFPFTATAGQSVYLDWQAASNTVSWKLKNPSGVVLASAANFVVSALDSGVPVLLATAGTYTIEVTGLFNSTPTYQFKLWNVPAPQVNTINLNDIVNGQIETPGVADEWNFTATAGQQVYVDFDQFSGGTLEARLIGPTGVVASWAQAFSPNLLDNGPLTLPATGNYTLRINGRGDSVFTYQFQLWAVPEPDVTTINVGDVIDGVLDVPGVSDDWLFSVNAGQRLYVDFQQSSGATLETRLTNPSGGTVYTANAFLLSQLDRGPLLFTTPGVYKLHVEAAGDATATYRFQIWDVPDDIIQTIPTNEPIFNQTFSPVERILHRFDATAGQEYFFDLLENTQSVRFTLLAPNGTALFADQTVDRLVAPLAATGTYTLVASSYAAGIITSGFGPFRFQMQEIASPQIGARDSRGTDFWVGYTGAFREIFGGSDVKLFLFLSAEEETSGTIFSTNGVFRTSFHLPAGETIQVAVPISEFSTGVVSNSSIRVRALDEISVYGLSFMPFGSDAFMAWPVDALGTEHLIASYGGGNGLRSSQLAVLGTENATTVTITPSVTFGSFTAGVPFNVTLNAGQAYQLESGAGLTINQLAKDLTGSIVSANKPVVVYGGHRATVIPAGFTAANHLVDQMPPTDTWGRRYVTVPLATRSNGDTFRFIAGTDDTEVLVNGALVATLDRGQFHEMVLVNRSEIISSQPILVAQYSNSHTFDTTTGDPSLMIVPPVEQFLSSYTVTAPTPVFDPANNNTVFDVNYVNVVAKAADVGTIQLDGALIATTLFQPIGTSGYFGAQVPVSPGSHHFEADQPFGVYSYGFDLFDAYSYPGGLNFSPIAAATNLALEPATATLALGTLQAFAATVTNATGQPLAGVRVDFEVTGANPQNAFAFTGANGHAVFSYSGEVPGNDTVTARVSALSATSTVFWSSSPPTITFTSPAAGSEHRTGSFVLITGLVLPGIVGTRIAGVTVNGHPVDAVDASGQFFASVQLADGANSFTFVGTDTLGQTATETLQLVGVPGSTGDFDYGNAQDISVLAQLSYARTTFNRLTEVLHTDMRLTNMSEDPIRAPVLAVFARITPPAVELAVAEGATPEGLPWVAFDTHLGPAGLAVCATSQPLPLRFDNPDTWRFSLDVTLLAQGNLPPAFTTQPGVEAVVGIPYRYESNATDPNEDELEYRLASGPANMTIDSATGVIDWTATAEQAGTFQVEIEADDGFGGVAQQQFQIRAYATLPNRPPVIHSAPITQVPAGTDYVYEPVATDADADTLEYFLDSPPSGMSINSQTGRIDFPDAPSGNYSVNLRIADGHGGQATQQYVLTVGDGAENSFLQILSQPPVLGVVGSLYIYLPEVARNSTGPIEFTLPQKPTGMTVNATTGEIRWTPLANQTGLSSVTLQVSDTTGGIAVQQWAIDVAELAPNQPPMFDSLPPRYATEGSLFDYLPAAHDPEQETLTFALDEGPASGTFDTATGRITWTPTHSELGFRRIRIRAIDPLGASALQTFFVEVRAPNTAPLFTSPPVNTTVAGSVYRDLVTATDAEDAFRFSLVAGPPGMSIDARSGLLFWHSATTDDGDNPVTLRVTDDRGLFTDRTFTITASGDEEAPEVSIQLSEEFIDLGTTTEISINVAAHDNVAVDTLVLTHQGNVIPFISGGVAEFTPPAPGHYTFLATATDDAGNVGTASKILRVFDPNDLSPPVIDIESPEDGATVTSFTDILGSITDDNLMSYQVEVARRGTNQFRLIHQQEGEPVGGLLAVLDPTLLENDVYVIRVTAEDVNFQVGTAETQFRLEGHAKIGNFETSVSDLTIPVAGGPAIDITRQFDTLVADTPGDFGFGWSVCALEPRIRESVPVNPFETLVGMFAATPFQEGDKIYITGPNCERYGFTFAPVPTDSLWAILEGTYGTIYEPRWIPDPGVHMELWGEWDKVQVNLSELSGSFNVNGLPLPLLRTEDGLYILAHLNVQYNPLGYRLIDKEGTMWHYSQFDGLQDVVDRNGNTLTVTEGGIFSSSGQSIQFQRDDAGRITKIIDPSNNEIHYTYNDAGELVNVEYPNGLSDEYSYDGGPEHFLSSINAALEEESAATQTVEITYNLANRLSQIFDGLGNINRQEYDLANNTETVFDALGNPTEMEYDDRGNMIREKNPLGNEAFYTYDADDNLTAIEDERGFVTSMTYDDRHNLTSITDALDNVTSFTYNARNDFVTQTDALGNAFTFIYNDRGNLIEIHGPLGVTAIFTYDAKGRPISVTNADNQTRTMEYGNGPHPLKLTQPDGKTQELTYNQFQQIKTLKDENGHITTLNYDSQGRILNIVDPLGQATTLTYFGNLLGSVIDKRGNTTRYEYERGRLKRMIDAELGVTSFTYDANGQKLTETDAENRVTTYAYYADRRLQSITDPLNGVTTYEYDEYGNQTAIIDANGHRLERTYDALNFMLTQSDPLGHTLSYTYDEIANVTSSTNANGHTTSYEYDDLHRLVRVIDPMLGEISYTYDLRNKLLTTTDPNGHTTTNEYDSRDRLIKMTDDRGGETTFGYDALGNRTSITDQRGHTTTFTYDELNRLISTTDPLDETTSYSYNAADRVTVMTDALGHTTEYEYDDLNRLTKITDALDGVWEYDYDSVGNRTSMRDAIGRTTIYGFDGLNRLTSITDPRNSVTQYGYDAVGNWTSVTDPNNNVTQFIYDDADRLIEQIDPLNHSSFFEHDAVGNLTEVTDRNGRVRTFGYDALERRTNETWWAGAAGGTTVNLLTFEYDDASNMLAAGDNFSHYAFAYDELNRQTTVDNVGTPGLPHVVLTSAYDATGNRTSIEDDTGVRVESAYDERNLLASRAWSGGGVTEARVEFSYDERGDRSETRRFGDVGGLIQIGRTEFEYDAKGRLTDITHRSGIDLIVSDYDYVYDLADQLERETHHGRTSEYDYDLAGQLTHADHSSQPVEDYQYDSNGNRNGGGSAVGTNNRIMSDGTFNYSYDNEGNLIRRTEIATSAYTEFSYDHRNRMVRGTDRSAGGIILREVNYTYDVFDRNIARTVDSDGAGPAQPETRATVYDGEHAWADFNAAGTLLARYLFGDHTDEIIARYRPGEGTAWYQTDRLGTVRDLVDSAGQLINTIHYDSFGNILSQTNPAASDRFTFTGREWDSDLGLYYYRARFYDPHLGRFMSQDPMGFAAGDANLYRYVGNNPLGATDPSGNMALTECAIVRGLNAALSIGCAIADLWASGDLASEDIDVQMENAMSLMKTALGILPGSGAGLGVQLVFSALTAKTAMDVVAPFLGPYAGVGMAIFGVYDAYKAIEDAETPEQLAQAERTFWVRFVCTAMDFAMMVWGARARCFVAGTLVVIDVAPDDPKSDLAQESQLSLLDVIGMTAVVSGVTISVIGKRRRRRCEEDDSTLHQNQDQNLEAGEDDPMRHYLIDDILGDETFNEKLIEFPPKKDLTSRTDEGVDQLRADQPSVPESIPLPSQRVAAAAPRKHQPTQATSRDSGMKRLLPRLALICLLTAGISLAPRIVELWQHFSSRAVASQATGKSSARFLTKRIEEIRPGERVLSHNPELTDEERALAIEPEPSKWRLIELELTGDDGHKVDIRLLRTLDWIRRHGAESGGQVRLNLEEAGVVGSAGVLSISACPRIDSGNGQVVTGTFRHIADRLVTIHIEGQSEPITCTTGHPFWSEDRGEFVGAAQLRLGERLRTADNRYSPVTALNPGPASASVFNLEVNAEHTYFVGSDGVLTHNATAPASLPDTPGVYIITSGNDAYVGSAWRQTDGMSSRVNDSGHTSAQTLLSRPDVTVRFVEVDMGTATDGSDRNNIVRYFEQRELNKVRKNGFNVLNAHEAQQPSKSLRALELIRKHKVQASQRASTARQPKDSCY